jgi:two-component system, cell cycle response regulator DivK
MAKKVLIVEDDPISADLYQELLNNQGYETVHVDCGRDALNEVTGELRPDLILMDIQLPDITGINATRMLKNTIDFFSIPIIAITAFPQKWKEKECREAGCDEFIAKPISVPEFLKKVDMFIG